MMADSQIAESSAVEGEVVESAAAGDDFYASLPPQERANRRMSDLASSFARVMEILARMHADEDWRYLTYPDGTPFTSTADIARSMLGVSESMARRHLQGLNGLYLPLSEVTVDGTRIHITSGDVKALGVEGAQEVVDRASERVDGVEDPEESTQIIRETLDEVRGEREATRDAARDAPEPPDDYDWGAVPDELPGESGSGGGSSPGGGDYGGDYTPREGRESRPGQQAQGLAGSASFDEEVTNVLSETPALGKQDGELGLYIKGLCEVVETDPSRVAKSVSPELAAVLELAKVAGKQVSRFQVAVETSPVWNRPED